jgi:phosphohistidine phosphatase
MGEEVMKLYVVRHAIAADRQDWEGQDDSQRPLTDRGREKMGQIVRGLGKLGVELDLIVTSPYVRARDTAAILADGLGLKASIIKFSDALVPTVEPSELLKEIAENLNVASLAVVGHEPHLSGFISYLLTGGTEMSTDLKKGGVCLLDRASHAQGWLATLEWLLTPKAMIAIGES